MEKVIGVNSYHDTQFIVGSFSYKLRMKGHRYLHWNKLLFSVRLFTLSRDTERCMFLVWFHLISEFNF